MKTVERNFYCINCGNKGLPIQRRVGKLKEKFHRKKLYCPYCQITINHVEVRSDIEAQEFKQMFLNGDFKEEALESINHTKGVTNGRYKYTKRNR